MKRTAKLLRGLGLMFLMLVSMPVWAAHYKTVENIPYRSTGDAYMKERCKLDVYYPTDMSDCPTVVWFHGGGLEGGNKWIPDELKNSGVVVVAVNYRFLPKVNISDCIDDAAAAVDWTFKHISNYGGSTKKIVVAGHSAGGYLVDMITLQKKWLAKYGSDADSIAALMPFSGQVITHFNVRKSKGVGPLTPTIDEFAPLYHVRKLSMPVVIISGDRNQELYGRYEEQAYFWRMLRLNGCEDVTLYEIGSFDHGSMVVPGFHTLKLHLKRIFGVGE